MVIPQKLKEKVKLKDRISRIHKFLHGTNCPESSEAVPPGQPEPSSSEKSSNGASANSAEDDPNQSKKTLWTPIVMKLKYQITRSTTKYRYYIYSNTIYIYMLCKPSLLLVSSIHSASTDKLWSSI